MNRKHFLKHCACGLCSCAAIGMIAPGEATAAEIKPPEDWRLPFVKKRYARLLEILAGKMDDAALSDILRQVGFFCGGTSSMIQKHKGDIEGFIRESKQQGTDVTYDRDKGIITVVGAERGDCFCPLIDKGHTPGMACDCSLGWQQFAYETMLGRKVRAELKESVLRGGKRCVFEIRVLVSPPQPGGENPAAGNGKGY